MDLSGQPSTGAAQRRKQQRLRSLATRAAADRCGPGHVATPLSPTGTEEGQAGEEESELRCTAKVRKTPPRQPVLFQPARRRARREAACQPGRAAGATGAGPEAHHGAHCRLSLLCSHGADPRRSCAADSGTAARHPPFHRHAHA